jgi:hypothetical protein
MSEGKGSAEINGTKMENLFRKKKKSLIKTIYLDLFSNEYNPVAISS